MRSQDEILKKIDGIAKMIFLGNPKKDPFYQQYKLLVHKLSWENAEQFMRPADRTDEDKAQWEKLNKLDKDIIIKEIKEQCDIGAMHVCGNDMEYSLFCATGLIAQFWLLGPSKDHVTRALFTDYMKEENIYKCCEPTFMNVCNELGFNWDRMKLCYQTGMFSRLEDKYGKRFKLSQDQQIINAIRETIDEKNEGKLSIEKDKEERQK